MFPLKTALKSLMSQDQKTLPERDEKTMVADSLMSELEYNIKELEKLNYQRQQEENRRKTGVDYSWLITTTPKGFEIPQLERLELEELFYQIKPEECGKILTLFRDALLNEPRPCELPSLIKSCARQIVQQRPKEHSLTEWVTQRTMSLASLKGRHGAKVVPTTVDPENNAEIENEERLFHNRNFISDIDSLPV